MFTRAVRTVAVLLCVTIVVACSDSGGDGASSTPSTTTTTIPTSLTKPEFLIRGNAICQTMNDRLTAIPPADDDPQRLAKVLDQSSGIVSSALTALRQLPIPAGDEATVNALYTQIETLVQKSTELAQLYRSGQVPAALELQAEAVQLQDEANAAAVAYGLDVCGT